MPSNRPSTRIGLSTGSLTAGCYGLIPPSAHLVPTTHLLFFLQTHFIFFCRHISFEITGHQPRTAKTMAKDIGRAQQLIQYNWYFWYTLVSIICVNFASFTSQTLLKFVFINISYKFIVDCCSRARDLLITWLVASIPAPWISTDHAKNQMLSSLNYLQRYSKIFSEIWRQIDLMSVLSSMSHILSIR